MKIENVQKLKFSQRIASLSLKVNTFGYIQGRTEGYRSALACTADKKECTNFYFEATIETKSETGDVRIGIATSSMELNGPAGLDKYAYAIGSKNGYAFHCSKRMCACERFGINDIISVYYIKQKNGDPAVFFFRNGNPVDAPFSVLDPGDYWPAVSVYQAATVYVNFGPYFAFETKVNAFLEAHLIYE